MVLAPDLKSAPTKASSSSFPDAVEKAGVAIVVLAVELSFDAVASMVTAPQAIPPTAANNNSRSER